MAGAIPLEPGAADLLAQSEAAARQDIDDPKLRAMLDVGQPVQGVPTGSPSAGGQTPPIPQTGPSQDLLDKANEVGAPPQAPQPAEPEKPKSEHGTGDLWDAQNAKDFLRDEFKGTGEEIAKAAPRVAAKIGGLITDGAAALGVIMQGGYKFATGKDSTAVSDAIFDFQKNYVEPAVEHWTPDRQPQAGDGEGTGGAAQAIGSGLEAVPYMLTGPAGIAAMLANSMDESSKQEIDLGHSLTSAITHGTVDTLATAAMLAVGSRDPSLVKRIIKTMASGDFIAVSQNIAKKAALIAEGKPDEAAKIHWNDGLGEATVQNGVFGFFKKPDAAKDKGKKPAAPGPTPEATATANAAAPQTGPSAEALKAAAAAAPPPPKDATATANTDVPVSAPPPAANDQPSAEPLSDLRAQFKDMADESTPRRGVFLSKDNQANIATTRNGDAVKIQGQRRKALKEGRVVTLPNGVLIVKDKSMVRDARTRLAQGEDPQAIIGDYTGAGSGKKPEHTAVVQGQTPEGAVATESAVTPAEVPAKVEAVAAEGKIPVVTTPAEAVQKRAEGVAAENTQPPQAPAVEATPVQPEPKAEVGLNPVSAEAMPKPAEPAAAAPPPAETTPPPVRVESDQATPVHAEPPAKVVETKPVDPDVAAAKKLGVSVEAFRAKREADAAKAAKLAAAAAESKVARPESGSESTPAAAAEAAKPAASEAAKPAAEPKPPQREEAKPAASSPPKTAMDSLSEALSAHEKQETPDEGKNKVPLKDRQDNASAFAQVLEDAAREAGESVPIETTVRAAKAAKAAKGLTLKSKNATAKGQGTGHVRVTALVAEMHKVARELLGKAKEGDEISVDPVAAGTKAKLEKVKEKASPTKAKSKHQTAAEQAEAEVRAQYPDVERLDENALTRRLLKKRTAEIEAEQKKGAATKESEKVQVAVNEKYKDQIEPAKKGDAFKSAMQRITARFTGADKEDLPKVRIETEQWLHENMGDEATRDNIDTVMAFLEGTRRDARGDERVPTKMSETMDEDEHEFSDAEAYQQGLNKTYHPSLIETPAERDSLITRLGHKLADIRRLTHVGRFRGEWDRIAERMKEIGDNNTLKRITDSGEPIGSHEFLDRTIRHAEKVGSMVVADILKKIRAHTPDVPIYVVTRTKNLHTGKALEGAAGLFHEHNMTIQLRAESLDHTSSGLRTIVHEIVHAATTRELNNPHSPLTKALGSAYAVFVNRLKARYESGLSDDSVIDKHIDYFDNTLDEKAVPPDDLMKHLYGIANLKEFVAEFLTNPKFVREIADSEMWASPREPKLKLPMQAKVGSLLSKIYTAIGKFFGVEDPKLVNHFADLISGVLDREAAKNQYKDLTYRDFHDALSNRNLFDLGVPPEDIAAAERGLLAMHEEAPPLVNGTDKPLAGAIDWDEDASHEARDAVRKTIFTARRRTVESLRKVTPGLKTESQIHRDYMRDFGGEDDPSNPMREVQETDIARNVAMQRVLNLGVDTARAWDRLSTSDDTAVGALLRDTTMNKIDPRIGLGDQPQVAQVRRGFAERHAAFVARLNKLSPDARKVYDGVLESNKRVLREERNIGIDTALSIYGAELTPAQKKLLYGVRHPEEFDELIGEGMPIDVGADNAKLRGTLAEFASTSEIEGPYAHLGRHGEHVVSAASEGSRAFDTQAQAKKFADAVNELNPRSRSNIVERGGKWEVDYKGVDYVSMHETMDQALEDKTRMEAAGFNMGHVTMKTLTKETTPLSAGMKELLAEAERKINRDGSDEGTEALIQSLRSAFLQIAAQRSAYSGSRLARKNVAGVKATEMRRNYADHLGSVAWHTAQMRSTFPKAKALARLRAAARDARGTASQHTLTRRGQAVKELGLRSMQDLDQYGKQGFGNATAAKLGFMNYLASFSHAIVWMTQNFTTGHWVAGAKWGYGRSLGAHTAAMRLVASPAFRGFIHGLKDQFDDRHIHTAIMDAVRQDPRFGKWARGENSAMQQLIDRGIINHGYAAEMRKLAGGKGDLTRKVFDFARLVPQVADQFNRISSALVGLELTGGDVRKAADFVDEVHARYDAKNQPRYFKQLKKVPFGNSAVMFKTYIQAMSHLTYGHLLNTMTGAKGAGTRGQSAKIAAGVIVGNMLFCGLYGAAMLEPIKLVAYGIKKSLEDEGEDVDIKAAVHHFLVRHLGKTVGNAMADGPIPHALGFDMSNRMGLTDMFFHDPPDLLTTDMSVWGNFLAQQMGPIPEVAVQGIKDFLTHWRRGEPVQALMSIIPVKQVKDATKAYEMLSTGKRTDSGRQLTQPSVYDAILQTIGLRPASAAIAADKAGEAINEGKARSAARKEIVRDLVRAYSTGKGVGAAMTRMTNFNRRWPQNMIMAQDIKSSMGFDTKNQVEDTLSDY